MSGSPHRPPPDRGAKAMTNTVRWSQADLDAHNAKQDKFRNGVKAIVEERKQSKYRNKKCLIDGLTFDSLKEGRRYVALKHMQMSGQIEMLETQVELACFVKEQLICTYRPDFRYYKNGEMILEDVKGRKQRDPVYVIKRKLVKALYGIEILET
jgi:hypothetical protein